MLIHFPKDLARVARHRRKKLGLTQYEVADLVGLKQKTVSAFENAPQTVKLSTAMDILAALRLDLTAIAREDVRKQSGWTEEW